MQVFEHFLQKIFALFGKKQYLCSTFCRTYTIRIIPLCKHSRGPAHAGRLFFMIQIFIHIRIIRAIRVRFSPPNYK